MGDRSSRDRQSESSRRRHESRRRQTTEYHPRGQGTVHIYRRARDGREGESGSAGPSNQGPAAPNFIWQGSVDSRHSNRGQQPQPSRAALNFYWHDSSNSGRSDRGQHLQIGAAPQSHDLDDRIEQWMQRLSVNDQATHTGQAGITAGAAVSSSSSYRYVDPNTTAPSVVGSHLSVPSYPSRSPSPQRPSWVSRFVGQQPTSQQTPVVVRRPGYVPPERRAQRERANQEAVVENSDRRRRRERREAERRRDR